MDNGISPDSTQEIDALHAQLAQESGPTDTQDSGMETQSDTRTDAAAGYSPNKDFCQEMLESALRWHAEATRREYLSSLAPIEIAAGTDQITRIAERAAMSPALQAAIAASGAKVLCKYGIAQIINDEAILVSALIGYFWEQRGAKKDRDALLEKYTPKTAQVQEEK